MSTKFHTINNFDDYLSFLHDHVDTLDNIQEQIDKKTFEDIICLRNQFFYILDLRTNPSSIVYVSPNIEKILGYDKNEVDLAFFYNIIHPDDINIILKASSRLIELQQSLKLTPLEYFGHLDYRIRKKDGEYISIERKNSNILNDSEGSMLLSISLFSENKLLSKTSKTNLYWTGPNNSQIDFSNKTFENSSDTISKREKEIIGLIAAGKSSKEISTFLEISRNTVDTHRRNILHKLGIKNSTELVMFAYEKGYI